MNNTHKTQFFSLLLWTVLISSLATVYYTCYLAPRDYMISSIAECQIEMDDRSIEGYEYCLQQFRVLHNIASK